MAALNGKKLFGAGRFWGINNITNPTPARFVLPQDMSITFKRGTKEIYGENQLAADTSSGEMSVTGKVTYGTTNSRVIAELLFGVSQAAGQTIEADNELGTLVSHAYTAVNGATFSMDLGVVLVSSGKRYVRVAGGSEVAGTSYSVNTATGVYTFNAAEAGTVFKFSYNYTSAAAGTTVVLSNQPMGKGGGDFTSVYVFPWTNNSNQVEQDILTLNSCIASDAEISAKIGDYAKPTFAFAAACDTNDNLGTFSFAEAA